MNTSVRSKIQYKTNTNTTEFIITATEHIHSRLVNLGLWEMLDNLPKNNRPNDDQNDESQDTGSN